MPALSAACTDTRVRAFEYLEGALDDAACAELKRHLVVCDPCRRAVQHDQRFLAALARCAAHERARHPCPTSLRRRIHALLDEREGAPPPLDD